MTEITPNAGNAIMNNKKCKHSELKGMTILEGLITQDLNPRRCCILRIFTTTSPSHFLRRWWECQYAKNSQWT
jgi:hypothetical protein